MKSKLFRLNGKDFIKGAIVATITGALTGLMQMLTLVPPSVDIKQIGIISLTSLIAYLIKNFASDENGDIKIK